MFSDSLYVGTMTMEDGRDEVGAGPFNDARVCEKYNAKQRSYAASQRSPKRSDLASHNARPDGGFHTQLKERSCRYPALASNNPYNDRPYLRRYNRLPMWPLYQETGR